MRITRENAGSEVRMRSEFQAGLTAERIYAEYADRYETGSRLPWLRALQAEVNAESVRSDSAEWRAPAHDQ